MNKFIIAGLFVVIATAMAQDAVTQESVASTVDPVEQAVANSQYVRLVLEGALVKANLPPHLEEQGNQVVADAEKKLDACEESVRANRLVWLYKVCTTTVLKTSAWQLKALAKQAASSTVAPVEA
uniref:CSON009220 protein n=1 Tax=Culicoides sonorensis TaxID=179676 RepID=A0A336M0D3_CULSO